MSALADDAGGNYLVRWESHFRVAFSEPRKRSLLTFARANYGLGGNGSLEKEIPSCSTAVGAENTASNEGKRTGEQVLISKILAGEKDLFIELVRPYQRTVYATVISMLGSKEDAEDVTQDALLKALSRLHQFRRESAFRTWLIQIAINEARMRRRKLRHGIMFSLTSEPDGEGAYVPKEFADWREIPSEALERNEIREALAKALTSLEEHYRLTFILRDVNELSITETASVLGISPAAVKSRLRSARLMLRDILSPGLQNGGHVDLVFKEVRKPWE
jgi:RNA polymerase sigma-70 factor (ECF subfamily)